MTALQLQTRTRGGFTLLEILIAVSIFAVVLGAINAVFYSALRLRNRVAALSDKSLPLEQAVSIMRRDLANIVPPGGTLSGQLQSMPSTNSMPGASGPAFFTSTGIVDETSPWAEVQKVSYALVESTNRFQGRDLVRLVSRNLLYVSQEQPITQWLLNSVQAITFSYYDGTQWRDSWDSTTETAKLPRGVKVQIQRSPDYREENARIQTPEVIELVVELLAQGRTNDTTQATTQQ